MDEDETTADGLTAVQFTLLSAVHQVATCEDAPAADYAGRALVRLLCVELGHPLPEPVERDGGLINAIYGKPIKPEPWVPRGDIPKGNPRPIRDQPQA